MKWLRALRDMIRFLMTYEEVERDHEPHTDKWPE